MAGYFAVVLVLGGLLIGLVWCLIIRLNSRSQHDSRVMGKIKELTKTVLARKSTEHAEGTEAHRVREAELTFVLELLADIQE